MRNIMFYINAIKYPRLFLKALGSWLERPLKFPLERNSWQTTFCYCVQFIVFMPKATHDFVRTKIMQKVLLY